MEVRAAGESVRSSQEAAWDVDDFQIKVCKVKQLPCLAAIEVLDLTEVHQVLAVSKDLDGERESMEVMLPGLQSMDDHKEFAIVDVVVLLGRDEGLGEVGARVPVAI